MSLWRKLKQALGLRRGPEHLRRGRAGEAAAKGHLKRSGLKFLTANFRSKSSEIDLVYRDGNCLVFVEVKARTEGGWTRPAAAVDQRKRGLLGQAAKNICGGPAIRKRSFVLILSKCCCATAR